MGKGKVLVTGATGVLGPPLVHLLSKTGYTIRILDLKAPNMGLLPGGVEVLLGDINDKDLLKTATSGVDFVFHLAAKLHINSPSPDLIAEYERVNVQGTESLAKASRDAGVKRLIFFSSICVYGATSENQIVDETSDLKPDTEYAKTKVDGEKIVLDTVPSVVLRLGAVYGPGMKGNYPRLIRAICTGLYIPVGSGRNYRTLIFLNDIAKAAMLAAEHPDAVGEIYNVTDGQIHEFNSITDAIYLALNRKPPRMHIPVAPVRLICGLIEDTAKFLRKDSSITRATVDKIVENTAVNGDKFQRELGFKPEYDLLSGWRKTAENSILI